MKLSLQKHSKLIRWFFWLLDQSLLGKICSEGNAVTHVYQPAWDSGPKIYPIPCLSVMGRIPTKTPHLSNHPAESPHPSGGRSMLQSTKTVTSRNPATIWVRTPNPGDLESRLISVSDGEEFQKGIWMSVGQIVRYFPCLVTVGRDRDGASSLIPSTSSKDARSR